MKDGAAASLHLINPRRDAAIKATNERITAESGSSFIG